MVMIEIASQGGSLAFQNKGWFQSSKAKRRDQLIHNLVHNVSNYPAWGQCLGPVLLLRYLVVLFSHGQGKKKESEWRKSLPASDTQKYLNPFLSFHLITSSSLFQHYSMPQCPTVSLRHFHRGMLPWSLFSFCHLPSLSPFLFKPPGLPQWAILAKTRSLPYSPTSSPHLVSSLIYDA